MNPTTILRYLTDNERQILKKELFEHDTLWDYHARDPITGKHTTALCEGKTVYVKNGPSVVNHRDNSSGFTKTLELLKQYSNNKSFGRIYWHRLLPGEGISRHSDDTLAHVKTNILSSRYQIYLEIPAECQLFLDDTLQNNKLFENSIVDFQLRLPHQYKNNSNKPWYFLVFDTMNF